MKALSFGAIAARRGKYRNSPGSTNPGFQKFTDRNWAIVAELEKVAAELGRGMAQVALNWAATRPGVASVIIGATRLDQINDNLGALDFEIPQELLARLEAVSRPATPFPYSFFGPEIQGGLTGGQAVGHKPAGYFQALLMAGAFAGVS
jgi:aryl-alcohol dehydrogenase-like predicted oxidoreductase